MVVDLAKAQPFPDGDKRTALFAANAHLIGNQARMPAVLLTMPYDDNDPRLADTFNDLLARAYLHNEHDGVRALMRKHGLRPV